jgi:hypothetical protein
VLFTSHFPSPFDILLSISGLRQVLLSPLRLQRSRITTFLALRTMRKYTELRLAVNKAFETHNTCLPSEENHFHHRRQKFLILTAIHRNKMHGRPIKGNGTAYVIKPSEITRDALPVKSEEGFRRVRKFSKSDTYLVYRYICVSAWNNSAPTGRVFIKFYIRGFLESLWRKFNFYLSLKGLTGTAHENLCTLILSR